MCKPLWQKKKIEIKKGGLGSINKRGRKKKEKQKKEKKIY